ncbi:MAG TPA: OmcA/MtrC family decaheme c-type cytochrome [Thermoanaerobaculia bacterium]|nr:OmcA/MtrC family decaheme c-type cytochrome [Thermoanaerobaculia bacterium]
MTNHGRLLRTLLVLAMTGAITVSASSAGRRRAVGTPAGPDTPRFKSDQVEAYLSDDVIAYIRPGLKLKVNSITIGADRKPVVDVTFTDDFDQPIDRLGKTTPGPVNASFILAWWDPAARHYTSYNVRNVTTPANSPRPGAKAVQATTDSGGTWTDLETGHSKYKFGTTLPENFDRTKTHTLGFQAFRNLTDIPAVGLGKNYYANLEHDFRPDGEKVTETWAKINDQTSCLSCHDKKTFGFHGSSARRDVKLCVMCHQPQTVDPDTGHTMDLKVMAHKIHAPGLLSSPYVIYGNAQSVHDYSHITYPQDVRNCENCHEGTDATKKPAQFDAWFTKPGREACGSCHDDINWVTGANHAAGAQLNDNQCASCHQPSSEAEFDASIKGAHMIPLKSKQLKGITATVVSATNMAAGKKPTAVFLLKNNDGTFIDATKLATFSPILAGATSDYTWYRREEGRTTGVYDATTGTTTYTFTNAIPDTAKGSWTISADIRRNATLKRGDGGADIAVQESTVNPIKYVSLTGGTATPRRTVVTMAQCNQCHDSLSLHGGQRNAIEECVICHNPKESDVTRRPANAGQPESISMQRMIHKIHTGHQMAGEYKVFGFGNVEHDFSHVTYPGDRTTCTACHTASSYKLPLTSGLESVVTLREYFTPQGPGTAACLSCHDSQDAAAHAFLNTVLFPGATNPSEACATCHGTGKDWSVERVHAK